MAGKIDGVVKVALIGSGGISAAHAAGFLKNASKIKVVALVDVSKENLQKRSDQLGGVAKQYSDWKVALKELGNDVDAVDICLPHHLHGAAIMDAAAAGKHILCEKPMCTDLAEAERIAEAVKKSGVTYMSAHNQLFMPVVQEAKKLIDSGAIGRIFHIRSQDCFQAGDWFRNSWRANAKTQGGGELIDTGYHPTYRLLYLAGSEVVSIHGQMGRFRTAVEGDDTASVQVRFANGAIGEILTSWGFANPYGTHQIHIVGEKGQIFGSENTLYYLPEGFSEPAKRQLPVVETFEAEISHFADSLKNGTRPIHSVEEGRAVLEVILKASQSAEGWQSTAVLKV